MDALIKQVLVDGPPLAVLCVVVWMFLKHTKSTAKETHDLFRTLQAEHLDARQLSREAINANTLALREATQAQTRLADTVQQCQFRCQRLVTAELAETKGKR